MTETTRRSPSHHLGTRRLIVRCATMILTLASATCVRSTTAQAVPTATGPGSRLTLGVLASGFQADYGKRYIGGGAFYADANLTPHLSIEAEVRSLTFHEEAGIRQNTYLAGPSVTVHSHALEPYAKLLVGVGTFRFPYGYANGRYFVVAPGAGIEYRVANTGLRLRLIDFEYQSWPQFTYGQLHPYGISAGVSLRLWRSETYRPD